MFPVLSLDAPQITLVSLFNKWKYVVQLEYCNVLHAKKSQLTTLNSVIRLVKKVTVSEKVVWFSIKSLSSKNGLLSKKVLIEPEALLMYQNIHKKLL